MNLKSSSWPLEEWQRWQLFWLQGEVGWGGRCVHGNPLCPGSSLDVSHFSCVRLFVTPWTVAYQAPLFTGFSQQEYWGGLPFPPPGGPPDPGIEPLSPALAGGFFTAEPPGKPHRNACCCSVAKSCPQPLKRIHLNQFY